MREFTPETLDTIARDIDTFRTRALFDVEPAGADVMAEQEYLLGLAHLDVAQRHMRLAHYHQARALADR